MNDPRVERIYNKLLQLKVRSLDRLESRNINSEDLFFLSFLTLSGAYLFVLFLGREPLYHWDEGIYAESALHMLKEGYWLTPHIEGGEPLNLVPFLGKPPLVQWLQALSMMVFGATKFAVRFPSAMSALLTSLVVYFFGKDVYNRKAGLFSASVFLSMPFIFHGFNMARNGALDTTLMLFGTLSLFFVHRAFKADEFNYLYYAFVFGSLGLLTKGLAVLIYPLAALPLVLTNYRLLKTPKTVVVFLLGLAVSLPWYLYNYVNYPERLLDEMIVVEIIDRIQISSGTESGALLGFMKYNYFESLPNMVDPWLYFLIPLVFVLVYAKLRGRNTLNRSGFFVWWFVSTLSFFVVLGNHSWYIAPVMVPLALLMGGFLEKVSYSRDKGLVVAYIAGLLLSVVLSIRMRGISPFILAQKGWLGFHGAESSLRFISSLSIFSVVLFFDQKISDLIERFTGTERDFSKIILCLGLLLLVLSLQTFPYLEFSGQGIGFDSENRVNPEEKMAVELNSVMSEDDTLYVSDEAHNNEMTNFAFFLEPSLQEWNESHEPEYVLARNSQTFNSSYSVISVDERNRRSVYRR